MARTENQKLKLVCLMRIFTEKTDDDHGITMPDIIRELDDYGIHAERKGIYDDICCLNDYGFEIEARKAGRTTEYHLVGRLFQLAELKLLVDSVQSAKFISARKSGDIIKKLETLCSTYEAGKLNRQVYVQGRVKTMNESILYNVDTIHEAISSNRRIIFQYWNWNIKKEMELRHGGRYYKVSPWGLSWDDENYYLVAFDDEDKRIKHYRVDKMLHISIVDEAREGQSQYKGINMADYSRRTFGMFGGEVCTVSLECLNSFAGVIIDRFGKDTTLIKSDDEHFRINVPVAVSRQFLGWVTGLGDGVVITGPDRVIEMMREEARRVAAVYEVKQAHS